MSSENLQLTFDDLEIEELPGEIEDQNSGHITYELFTYPADFTLEVLASKYSSRQITVPPFQRKYVWTLPQASRLIESFLIGLPVPSIFFYSERTSEELLIVDGLQRVVTIVGFLNNEFGTPETGQKGFALQLDEKSKYHGKRFTDLPEPTQRSFLNTVLRSFIMKQLDPDDNSSIFQVFERLNTGGTLLKSQEVRRCLLYGQFSEKLDELNRYAKWRAILGNTNMDRHQKDVELVLRFLALNADLNSYEPTMKDFLTKFMSDHREASETAEMEGEFKRVVDLVQENLGDRPFHIRSGLNAAVMDSVFLAFSHATLIPADIKERYIELVSSNKAYLDAVTSGTTNEKAIETRISEAARCLFGEGHPLNGFTFAE